MGAGALGERPCAQAVEAGADEAPQPATNTRILQGMIERSNVEPVYEAQMQETDLDFRSHLLKIKSMNPDVLAIGESLNEVRPKAGLLPGQYVRIQLVTGEGAALPCFVPA